MSAPVWDGVPLNPERDGWHWISTLPQLPPSPWRWSVADGVGDWFAPGSRWCSPLGAVACHTYLGPCLTPADLAAAVEAAVQAERADCARHIDARVAGWRNAENPEDETVNGYLAFAGQLLSHEIRARGPADALAAALAKAREDALRECEAVAMACQQENIDLGLSDMAAGSGEVVAAIRALAGKEPGK